MRAVRFEVFRQTPERVLLRYYGDDGRLAGTRELAQKDVDLFVAEVENAYSASAAVADHAGLGRRLYDWLDGPTERWLATARQGVPGLAVHVDGDEKLRHLPWELMADGGTALCGQETAPLTPVRRSGKVARKIAVQNRPLRLLFLAASPTNVEPVLSFEDEEKRILEATLKQPIELEVEESGSLLGLKERVESAEAGYFDVLHLTGHADVKDDKPHFLMENELGGLHQASAEEIAAAFVGNWPALVFLSGCKTGQATELGALPLSASGWSGPERRPCSAGPCRWATCGRARPPVSCTTTWPPASGSTRRWPGHAPGCSKRSLPTGICCGSTPTRPRPVRW